MSKDQVLTRKELREELGEFAEKIILPAVEKIVDDRIEAKVPGMLNKAKLEIIDHVDDKIADLRGDIILLLRKEDRRVYLLIDKLRKKNILEDKDVKELEEMRVFVQA